MQVHTVEDQVDDERGFFRQLISGTWRQINVFSLKQGCVRGGHYHKLTRETFYLATGKVTMEIRQVETGKIDCYQFETGACFTVEPWELHTLTALEDTLVVVALSRRFKPSASDIFLLGKE